MLETVGCKVTSFSRADGIRVLLIARYDDQPGEVRAVVALAAHEDPDEVYYRWLLREHPECAGKSREECRDWHYAWNVYEVQA